FGPEGGGSALADPDEKAIHLKPRSGDGAYALDLHWQIERPRLVPVDHRDFWAEPSAGLPADADGAGPAAPAPDLVGLVLCLHLWRHAVTLKTLVDFAAFVQRFDDQVPAVRARLARAGAGQGLDLALALAQRVFGVRSRWLPRRGARRVVLPWLERCLRLPFADRGLYFSWLVLPLQFDGAARSFARIAGHLIRPGARDGGPRAGSRIARVGRLAARLAFQRGRLFAGKEDAH